MSSSTISVVDLLGILTGNQRNNSNENVHVKMEQDNYSSEGNVILLTTKNFLIIFFVSEFSAQTFVDQLLSEGKHRNCDDTNEEFDRDNKLPDFYDEKLFER